MNIPNIISLLRVLAVPLLVWLLLEGRMVGAFWVFVVAGLSDAVDGFIAKTFDMETELGKYLDPLADKALLVSVFVTLGVAGQIPSWLVILVVFRDVLIVGGAILFETMTGSLTMQPLLVSKANTALQIMYAAAAMAVGGYGINAGAAMDFLALATALVTIASGISYVVVWAGLWSRIEGGNE